MIDKLYKDYLRNKNSETQRIYRKQRNLVTKLIRLEKSHFWTKKLGQKPNAKNIFDCFREGTGQKNNKNTSKLSFSADDLNNFFVSVGETISNTFKREDKEPDFDEISNSMFFDYITADEVSKVLISLKEFWLIWN